MKQSWLDALKGLTVSDAQSKVKDAGLTCNILPKGSMRIMLAVANTVFLYDDAGKVVSAESGDGVE